MPTLLSPGVLPYVIDETFSTTAGPGTVPLIFIATASNKTLPSGTGIAKGTIPSNAGVLYTISSQRELLQTFGAPYFRSVSGTVEQCSEVSEYGLHAAYSYLGLANSALVIRADIDLKQLEPTEEPPRGDPVNGTYWFDILDSEFGAFRANGNKIPGLSWDHITVHRPTSHLLDPAGTAPAQTYGVAGDLAVIYENTGNRYFEKIGTDWFHIGSQDWLSARANTVIATANIVAANIPVGETLVINSITVTTTGGNSQSLVDDINAANIPNLTASLNIVGLKAYLKMVITPSADLIIGNTSSSILLTQIGLEVRDYLAIHLIYDPHTMVPDGRTKGSIWIKTTSPNKGAKYIIKRYNSSVAQWQTISAPFYADEVDSEANQGFQSGRIFVKYNAEGDNINSLASHAIMRLNTTSSIGTETAGVWQLPTIGDSFTIRTINPTINKVVTAYINITSSTLNGIVNDIVTGLQYVGITHIIPKNISTLTVSKLRIDSTSGFAFDIKNESGTPLTTMGFTEGVYSNWDILNYEASDIAPSTDPSEGTLWFNPALNVDIMVNNGQQWKGYKNLYPDTDIEGPWVTSAEPTAQQNGAPLVDNDLWIKSDDISDYPRIYRYLNGMWTLLDNTDQSTPFGVVFGDIRENSGPADPSVGNDPHHLTWMAADVTPESIVPSELVRSDWCDPVDLFTMNPQIFPAGIICFNTRCSTYNVKVWRPNFYKTVTTFSVGKFLNPQYEFYHPGSVDTAIQFLHDKPGRWDTFSGNDLAGVGYFGRWAQRHCVIRALKAQIVANQDIRSEWLFFNLMATPGYCECFTEMLGLNVDRLETAFIITDVPYSLTSNTTDIISWANNSNNAAEYGRFGRTQMYSYAAMYFPWALGTDLSGNSVMIPSSTVALRTYGYNDQVAYLWFPPAGTRRGVISNAQSVGYFDLKEREYRPVILNRGTRNSLYINKINPLAFIPGQGLLVYGDKTMCPNETSAMSRVNVVRLVCYLKYQLNIILQPFLFELNLESTRTAARRVVEQFMHILLGLEAITDYSVECSSENNTPETIARNELWVDVICVPSRSINFIYVPIRLRNEISG